MNILSFLYTETPLAYLIQSFWRDEAFTYLLAKKNIFQIIYLTGRDFNPPLYYIVLHFWIKIFGHSEIALRSLSLAFYWATVYIGFLIFREVLKLNLKKSFFYLVFLIVNPLLVYYAFEARMYTMFAFLATLSFYYFYKKNFKSYLIATILGLFTHYFMTLVVFSQIAFSFFIVNKKDRLQTIKHSLKALIFFLPWGLLVVILKGFTMEPFWIKKSITFKTLINLGGFIYTGYERDFSFADNPVLNISFVLILLFLIGVYQYKTLSPQKKYLFLYLIFWTLLPILIIFLISFLKPLFLSRYLIFTSVGFVILVILILERMSLLPRLISIVILFLITLNYQKLEIKNRRKADLRKTFHEIKVLAKKDDLLYVKSELDFHLAQYYFDEDRVFIYGKSYQKIPSYVGKILIPKEKVTQFLPRYPKKAFILNKDGSYDIKAVY